MATKKQGATTKKTAAKKVGGEEDCRKEEPGEEDCRQENDGEKKRR